MTSPCQDVFTLALQRHFTAQFVQLGLFGTLAIQQTFAFILGLGTRLGLLGLTHIQGKAATAATVGTGAERMPVLDTFLQAAQLRFGITGHLLTLEFMMRRELAGAAEAVDITGGFLRLSPGKGAEHANQYADDLHTDEDHRENDEGQFVSEDTIARHFTGGTLIGLLAVGSRFLGKLERGVAGIAAERRSALLAERRGVDLLRFHFVDRRGANQIRANGKNADQTDGNNGRPPSRGDQGVMLNAIDDMQVLRLTIVQIGCIEVDAAIGLQFLRVVVTLGLHVP